LNLAEFSELSPIPPILVALHPESGFIQAEKAGKLLPILNVCPIHATAF